MGRDAGRLRVRTCLALPDLHVSAGRGSCDALFVLRAPVIAGLLVTVLGIATARAQPPGFTPPAPPPEDPGGAFAFVAPHLGLGTPLGLLGLEAGIGDEWFRASVGVGVGFSGLELAAMVHAMTEVRWLDLGIGAGVSRGGALHALIVGWSDPSDPPFEPQFDSNTVWLDAEVVVEVPFGSGVFGRLYGGASYAASIDCYADSTRGAPDRPCDGAERLTLVEDPWMPYLGVALGVRWPAPDRQALNLSIPGPFTAGL